MTPSNHFHTIVVGVGGMGSAACYYLARRGKRVLGLEQFDIPHTRGSSHGYTRIIRLAYYEHPSYVMLLKRSYELWHEIEKAAGEKLLHYTGSIDAGPADSWVFKGALQSAMQYDLPHEVLTGKEMEERFPGYRFPHDILALYQPQGGFLTPERCIVAYANAAMALGAEIHGREKVLGFEPTATGGVRVRTDRDEYFADSLVVTAGAWDAQLMPFLRGLAVPERQVLAWLQPRRPELFQPSNFPVFNCLVPEGRFYGFPIHGVPGFKFGKYHHFEERGDPDRLIHGEEGEPRPDDEAMLRDFASRYFPDGAGPTMTLAACMFTNTPDGHFIIDQHPQYPQICYASPCSGHGYKFASVIGEIMAELADLGYSRWDISLFRADRFGVPTSALFRDKGPAPRARIEHHDPFGAGTKDPHRGKNPVRVAGLHDTRDPRYWQRNAVTPFWL
ncbi:MAG: N-methyl-L-tryptophan oxidase [Candidatus Brachytrichaceae bacterium NZ_4S206]|jgi:sarcosine oxidase